MPQGSILGPLLFLLYINDLANVSDVIFSLFFADDSDMFLSGKNRDDLIKLMNTEITKIIEWLRINKLLLNLKNTFYGVQKKSLKNRTERGCDHWQCENDFVTETKFLGVILDQHLTFWITYAIHQRKGCKGHWYFVQSKKYLKESSMKTLYYAFIYPYLTYCITVWGNTFNSVLEPLIVLQKGAIGIVCGAQKFDHTYPLFQLSKLCLSETYMYTLPSSSSTNITDNPFRIFFSGFFTINETIHNHYTRQIEHFHTHLAKSSQRARTLRCTGVKINNYSMNRLNYNCSIQTKTQRTYLNVWYFTLVRWYTIIIYTW